MLKKTTGIIIALILVTTLAACNNGASQTTGTSASQNTSTQAPDTTTSPPTTVQTSGVVTSPSVTTQTPVTTTSITITTQTPVTTTSITITTQIPVATTSTPAAAQNPVAPEGSEALGDNIFYYDFCELQSGADEGLTPKQGAELLIYDVLAGTGVLDHISPAAPNNCVYIAFDDYGIDHYYYTIATGIVPDDLIGNFYEADYQYRVFVEYATGVAGLYEDGLDEDGDEQADGDNAFWEGDYLWNGSYLSEESQHRVMNIINFNGDSFEFSFVADNGDAYSGVAGVIDNLAHFRDLTFDIAESCDFIIVSLDDSLPDRADREQFVDVYYRNSNEDVE
jgi:hypothetical protein